VSKKFFKDTVATAFDDPRVTLLHADAAVYLRENSKDKFDVIIVDSSDPVGPAEVLYRAEFYENMKNSLSPDGIICTQGECLWLHLDLIVEVMQRCQSLFPTVNYSYTTIPTYPSGQIGFIMCSLDQSEGVLVTPKRTPDAKMAEALRYYNAKIHEASFVLPSFAERKIATVRK
jgi:spermidine synthase